MMWCAEREKQKQFELYDVENDFSVGLYYKKIHLSEVHRAIKQIVTNRIKGNIQNQLASLSTITENDIKSLLKGAIYKMKFSVNKVTEQGCYLMDYDFLLKLRKAKETNKTPAKNNEIETQKVEQFRVITIPAMLGRDNSAMITNCSTIEEVILVKDAHADLLLFMQDELKIMEVYSNAIFIERFKDSKWATIDIDDFEE